MQALSAIARMSVEASVIALVVAVAGLLLRAMRAPRALNYALWGLTLFHMVCPVSYSLPLSPLHLLQTPLTWLRAALGGITPNYARALAIVYIAGVAATLLAGGWASIRLRRAVRPLEPMRGRVYRSAKLTHPVVIGLFQPRIVLPKALAPEELPYVLRHEQTHILRLDHLAKPVAYMALALHWFNPLLWLAYFLMLQDMEAACDERALREMGDVRDDYATSLPKLAAGFHRLGAPFTLVEGGAAAREKHAQRYRRCPRWLFLIGLLLCVLTGLLCLADAPAPERAPLRAHTVQASHPLGQTRPNAAPAARMEQN